MSRYIFETKMEVRDYECDIEGIVNNANYLHYMEHTRHLFLKECGLSFAEMHNKGVDAVVAENEPAQKVKPLCLFGTASNIHWISSARPMILGKPNTG